MANTEKWDLTDIYADDSGFEKDIVRINELAKTINGMQGKLADIAVLREVLLTDTELSKLLEKVMAMRICAMTSITPTRRRRRCTTAL